MRKVFIYFTILAAGIIASTTVQAQVNMSRFITLTVAKDSEIKLNFKAAANDTPVKIKCGNLDTTFTVGTELKPKANRYTAGDNIMTIYGDLSELHCNKNEESLTAIDLSNNTELTVLSCYSNQISSLDVTKLTKLTDLYCYSNQISSLDLRNNTQLKSIYCAGNQLSSLDVSNNKLLKEVYCHGNRLTTLDITKNTLLTKLNCFGNKLTTLDVSKCTKLINFDCSSNQLSSLDVSNNTLLKKLNCYDNAFTTQALDDIYCQLPNRNDSTQMGVIKPIYDYESENAYIVDATNAANATAKNWRVQYYNKDNTDIPATKGQYDCNSTGVAEEATVDEHVSLQEKR